METGNVVTNVDAVTADAVVTAQEPAKTEPAKTESVDSAEIERLKAALSRANTQAAEYKRQLREKQTETERTEAERAEQDRAMREELEMLRKEKQVSDYTAKCVALNFEADLAAQTANALSDGNMEAVFDCLKAFVEATKTRLENEALNRQPGLTAGIPPTQKAVVDADMEQMRRWMGVPIHR